MSYQEALSQVKVAPTEVLGEEDMLNRTVTVGEEAYLANINIYVVFEEMEVNHETYRSEVDGSTPSKSSITSAVVKEAGSTSSDATSVTTNPNPHGISLFIRAHKGITATLASKAGLAGGIPILLESSYGHKSSALLKGSPAPAQCIVARLGRHGATARFAEQSFM
ncbi:hypothetical protein BGZ61DRAFT_588810 [Ilyonectria robusta]|uniref:uncharacterized protein n=1 Tax=Ilyonectria robusta TaxID=1079257 RepID=UPI001E8D0D2C|nr:uncharacterized protein BGZ61DRAFT_588810 [Ilyonectria robusta]KAH8688155.1 hypothetical protein BGZ61DRAFT_588810 [Ilyonectria robusta]